MLNTLLRYTRGAGGVLFKPSGLRNKPLHMILETTTVCPFNCIMCSRAKEVKDPHHMPYERYTRIIDEVRPVHLYFSSAGEPLLHPEQPRMIRYAKQQGCKVCLVSTLAALAFPLGSLVESGLDLLKVSIDGATEETYRKIRGTDFFPRVLEYIRKLNEIKKMRGVSTPFIRFQFVVQKANYREAAGVVRLAHQLGLDAVFFKPLEIARIEERVDHLIGGIDYDDLKARLFEAREVGRERGVKTNLDDFLEYLLPNYWQIYHRDETFTPLSGECIIPWFSAVVRIQGDVGFCCYAKIEDAKVGNLFEDDFMSIWNGARYRAMRAKLRRGGFPMPKCAFCVPQRLSHLFNYRRVIPGYRR